MLPLIGPLASHLTSGPFGVAVFTAPAGVVDVDWLFGSDDVLVEVSGADLVADVSVPVVDLTGAVAGLAVAAGFAPSGLAAATAAGFAPSVDFVL
jgi:hypothetical protein